VQRDLTSPRLPTLPAVFRYLEQNSGETWCRCSRTEAAGGDKGALDRATDGFLGQFSRIQPSSLRKCDTLRSVLVRVQNAIHRFAEQARHLLALLRSSEGDALNRADLDALEIQIYLLDKEVTKRREANQSSSSS